MPPAASSGADEVKAQLKAKQDGEPVAKPHAKAASLFALYDSARLKALEPAQAAAIRRIDALLDWARFSAKWARDTCARSQISDTTCITQIRHHVRLGIAIVLAGLFESRWHPVMVLTAAFL